MAMTGHPPAKDLLRQLMKLFRSNRAPFSTSKFGKTLVESKHRLIKALRKDPASDVLEMFLPGIAKDSMVNPADMTPEMAIKHLERSAKTHVVSCEASDSRWGSWLDHCQAWDQVWHCESMTMLFCQWEAGENPYDGKMSGEVPEDDRSYSIKKVRWQAHKF